MGRVFEVPCGKCMACRISKTAEWTKRLMDEKEGKPACFITLTYDDPHLPPSGLVKEDLTNFIKRLRRRLEPKTVKYYACGEYGDTTARPHYHIIVIGWEPPLHDLIKIRNNLVTSRMLNDTWGMGYTSVGTVTKESAQYVAGYVRKKIYKKKKKLPEDKKPTWSVAMA